MCRLFAVFLINTSAVIAAAFAQITDPTAGRISPNDVLKQMAPEYPLEARRRHETGTGILILHVDHLTGRVTSVTVRKSTGYKILDDAGIRAFS